MKTLKTAITAFVLLISTSLGFAQSLMKDPVSYTLKNGMTIVIAENEATSKVFANLSFEATNRYHVEKATVQEVMTTLLNQQLNALDSGLSYNDKGVNLATTSTNFETVMQTLLTYIHTPEFTQNALDKAKAKVFAHLTAEDKYFPKTVNKASLEKLTLEDINTYYSELNNPAQTCLTVAGNINPAEVKSFTKNVIDKRPTTDNTKTYLADNE